MKHKSSFLFLAATLLLAANSIAQTPAPAAGAMGTLKTKVSPSRAGVFVDGKYVGPAENFKRARSFKLTVGVHEVRLSEPRYQDKVQSVAIAQNQTVEIKEKLVGVPLETGPFGVMRIQHPDHNAAVYINGKFFGHVDEFDNFAQGIKINAGEYDVRIEPLTKGEIRAEKVVIKAGETTIMR